MLICYYYDMDSPDSDPESFYFHGTTFRNGRERDLEDYETTLGFKREDIIGKVVLDIGAGEKQRFASEIMSVSSDTIVVSVNPDFANSDSDEPPFKRGERYRSEIQKVWEEKPHLQGKSVAAVGQALPFADNSFDEVFALYSLSSFASPDMKPEVARLWASEIARVLKKGGEARIAPIDGEFFQEEYAECIKIWKSMGMRIELIPIKVTDVLGSGYTKSMGRENDNEWNSLVFHHVLILTK